MSDPDAEPLSAIAADVLALLHERMVMDDLTPEQALAEAFPDRQDRLDLLLGLLWP